MTKSNDDNANNPQDPIEDAFAKLGKARNFEIGDLVRFDGRLYFVEAYQFEAERRGDHHAEEVTYQIEAVHAKSQWDFDLACDDELTFVADCAQASEWLRQNGGIEPQEEGGFIVFEFTYGDSTGKPKEKSEGPPKHRAREKAEIARRKRYRARADELLDAYNDAQAKGEPDAAAQIRRQYETEAAIFEAGGSIGAEGGSE